MRSKMETQQSKAYLTNSKITDSTIDKTWLTDKVTEAENAGLIKKAIVNHNDAPYVQWINRTPTEAGPDNKQSKFLSFIKFQNS